MKDLKPLEVTAVIFTQAQVVGIFVALVFNVHNYAALIKYSITSSHSLLCEECTYGTKLLKLANWEENIHIWYMCTEPTHYSIFQRFSTSKVNANGPYLFLADSLSPLVANYKYLAEHFLELWNDLKCRIQYRVYTWFTKVHDQWNASNNLSKLEANTYVLGIQGLCMYMMCLCANVTWCSIYTTFYGKTNFVHVHVYTLFVY